MLRGPELKRAERKRRSKPKLILQKRRFELSHILYPTGYLSQSGSDEGTFYFATPRSEKELEGFRKAAEHMNAKVIKYRDKNGKDVSELVPQKVDQAKPTIS